MSLVMFERSLFVFYKEFLSSIHCIPVGKIAEKCRINKNALLQTVFFFLPILPTASTSVLSYLRNYLLVVFSGDV